jgi:predicted transcriptional regulator of viral defense system
MDDNGPDWDRLFSIASSQSGYFNAAQARACAVSLALLSHHAKGGRLLRIRQGIYRFQQYPSSPREEVMQAWLAMGERAVVSHESALDLLGLADTIPERIHLTVPRSARWRRASPGVAIHTSTRPMERGDVVTRGGMRVTSATRTILDVAQTGGAPDQVARAAWEAIERGMATREQLLAGGAERGEQVRRLMEEFLVKA